MEVGLIGMSISGKNDDVTHRATSPGVFEMVAHESLTIT
jgi:hypothetical protein